MMNAEASSAAELSLAADFDNPSKEDWEQEVLRVLNRGRPEGRELGMEQAYRRLTSHTADGLEIKPLYTQADATKDLGYPGVAPFTRGTTIRSGHIDDSWHVAQLHEDPDPAETRQAILTDLERGGTAVWIRVDPDAVKRQDLAFVLSDVMLDLAPVHVSSRTDQLAAAKALADVFAQSGINPAELSGSFGIDPIGFAALHGTSADLSVITEAVELARGYPGVKPLVVDATVFHNAGAGDVQELAYAIAAGVEYVRALTEAGLSPEEAFEAILFRVSTTTEQFLTMSRLRALRTLWSRVGEVLEVPEEKRGAMQHAVTSFRQISRDDAYVNVLRGTIACFAAAAGGAEIQTVLPLDAAIGLPDLGSRRIARNTQVLLAEESHLSRVNDPAGGSWYVESMTKQLCEKAWDLFGAVDEDGFAAAVADGTVSAQIAETNETRAKLLATRKLPLTGVSMFPDPTQETPQRKPRPEAPELGGLRPIRDAKVFEDLRDRSRAAAQAGAPPKVMLACLGTRRDFGAREGFTSNLFRVGGLETPLAEGSEPEDFARQLTETGSRIAVLCSNARVYKEQGLAVANALKDAGAEQVFLAGQLRELGTEEGIDVIDGNIFDGMDVVELLTETLDKLEA